MNFSTFVHSLLLLAATSISAAQHGVPSASRRERAAALRNNRFGNPGRRSSSSPLAPPQSPLIQSRGDLKPSAPGVSYHWAGAVVPTPSGENITSVTATMTLPELTAPDDVGVGPAGEYCLYVWVGIDGLQNVDPGTCNSLWQTGFAGQIANGVTTWWGWAC